MKSLYTLLLTFFGVTAAYAQCNHTLTMIDSYGDGWNGATVDLTVNGSTVLSGVSCSGASTDASFTASTGDAIALANWVSDFYSGLYHSEISWELKDGTGALISSGIWGDVSGGSGFCPSCPKPTALTATNVNSSSADISWTAGGTETEWWLVVNGVGQSVTSSTSSLTTLSATTSYSVQVAAICGVGDTSTLSAPIAFTTPGTGQIYFSEDFESGISGWSQITNATDGGWLFGSNLTSSSLFQIPSHTIYAATTDGACYCDKSNDWLISPAIDLSNANFVELKFDAIFGDQDFGSNPPSGTINASIDGGSTWTLLKTLPRANASSNYVYSWNTYVIDISEYAGNNNLQIGFKYNDGNSNGFGFALDNIEIAEISTNKINVYCQSFYVFEWSSSYTDQDLYYLQSDNVTVRSVHDNSGYGSVSYGNYQGWPDPIVGLTSPVINCSDPMQAALIFTNKGNTNLSRNIKLVFEFSNLVQGNYSFSFDYLFNNTGPNDDYVFFKADNNAQQQSTINYSSSWTNFHQDQININSSLMVIIDVTTGWHFYKHLTIDNFLLQRDIPTQPVNLIKNKPKNSKVKIYPNPADDLVQIQIVNYNGSFEAELYDLMGKLLETTNNTSLSLSDYPSGIYFLKVEYGDKTEELRLVKE